MKPKDPMVSALVSLCEREGGHKNVAAVADVSAENLWQILNGTPLPSGNPRGVGARLRGRLTAAYPEWLSPAQSSNQVEEPRSPYRPPANSRRVMGAIMDLHAALASVDKHTRTAAAALLAGIADHVEDLDYVERQAGKLAELLDPPAPPKRAVAGG